VISWLPAPALGGAPRRALLLRCEVLGQLVESVMRDDLCALPAAA
jgi:hypothetical protein